MAEFDEALCKVIDTEVFRPKILTDNKKSHGIDCSKLVWRTRQSREIPAGASFQYLCDTPVIFRIDTSFLRTAQINWHETECAPLAPPEGDGPAAPGRKDPALQNQQKVACQTRVGVAESFRFHHWSSMSRRNMHPQSDMHSESLRRPSERIGRPVPRYSKSFPVNTPSACISVQSKNNSTSAACCTAILCEYGTKP